jgi:hypothetical protein
MTIRITFTSLDLRWTVESANDHQLLFFSSLAVEYWRIELKYVVTLYVLKYPSFLCYSECIMYSSLSLSLLFYFLPVRLAVCLYLCLCVKYFYLNGFNINPITVEISYKKGTGMRKICFTWPLQRRIRTEMINLLKTKRNLLYLRSQSVPRCKHFPPQL